MRPDGVTGLNHGEAEKLAGCYRNSMVLCVANGVKTIAFPAISRGIHGYPIPDATRIAVETVRTFLAEDQTLQQVISACFGAEVLSAFQDALEDDRRAR